MTNQIQVPRYRVYVLRALLVDETEDTSTARTARLILEDTETGDKRAFDRPSALSAFLETQRPLAALSSADQRASNSPANASTAGGGDASIAAGSESSRDAHAIAQNGVDTPPRRTGRERYRPKALIAAASMASTGDPGVAVFPEGAYVVPARGQAG